MQKTGKDISIAEQEITKSSLDHKNARLSTYEAPALVKLNVQSATEGKPITSGPESSPAGS